MKILQIFIYLCAILLVACNSDYRGQSVGEISLWKSKYNNGAPTGIIHYDKSGNYSGSFFYPDGTPQSVSNGKILEINDSSISVNHKHSLRFYPDGTPIPSETLKDNAISNGITGISSFIENGDEFFVDFRTIKIGDEFFVTLYIYPDSKEGKIIDRFIVKCRYSKSKWISQMSSLFGQYKLDYTINNEQDKLNIQLFYNKSNTSVFEFSFKLPDDFKIK